MHHLICSWECHGTGYGHCEECPTFFFFVDILRMSGCESTLATFGILTGVAGNL